MSPTTRICSITGKPWDACDCGYCERGPSTARNVAIVGKEIVIDVEGDKELVMGILPSGKYRLVKRVVSSARKRDVGELVLSVAQIEALYRAVRMLFAGANSRPEPEDREPEPGGGK